MPRTLEEDMAEALKKTGIAGGNKDAVDVTIGSASNLDEIPIRIYRRNHTGIMVYTRANTNNPDLDIYNDEGQDLMSMVLKLLAKRGQP